jgi:hypothetical protein
MHVSWWKIKSDHCVSVYYYQRECVEMGSFEILAFFRKEVAKRQSVIQIQERTQLTSAFTLNHPHSKRPRDRDNYSEITNIQA